MYLPIRKSPRIPKYDYSSENYYFITICTHNKNCIFGLPENRTALGDLTQNHILEIETHYTGVIVDKFVVMPNHVHIIRDQSSYEKIWLYIENNPIEWKEDCFYQQNSNQ